jgi:hypothetical protein
MEYWSLGALILGFGIVVWLLLRLLGRTERNDGATHGGGGIGPGDGEGGGGH